MAAPEGHFLEAAIHAVDSLTLRDCYKKQVFYDELFERKLKSKRLFNVSNSWSDVTPSEAPLFSFPCGMGPYFPVIRSAFNTLRFDADNMEAPLSLIVRYTIIFMKSAISFMSRGYPRHTVMRRHRVITA
jgi:hypothetical protein